MVFYTNRRQPPLVHPSSSTDTHTHTHAGRLIALDAMHTQQTGDR